MKGLTILIATHKKYEFPSEECYIPIQVGYANHKLDLAILRDSLGENISEKNPNFCELTALYWAWKNGIFEQNDYVGLVHYRRYFSGNGLQLKGKRILSEQEIKNNLANADCIVGKKRNYCIESVYSHYKNAHHIEDLDKAIQLVLAKNSDYSTACEQVLNGKTLHLFNMFVMKSDLSQAYCEWLFPILFELEKQIDISNYSPYQKRVFGFIAERLFNIWLVHNHIRVKEAKVVNLEPENLLLKVVGMLKRKFLKNDKK